MPRCLDSL